MVVAYEGKFPPLKYRPELVKDVRRADISVNATGKPIYLVFHSHDPVEWNIIPSSNTQISGVYLSGANPQIVTGIPASIPVTDLSRLPANRRCDYTTAFRGISFSGREKEPVSAEIKAALEQFFGTRITSLTAEYKIGNATIKN